MKDIRECPDCGKLTIIGGVSPQPCTCKSRKSTGVTVIRESTVKFPYNVDCTCCGAGLAVEIYGFCCIEYESLPPTHVVSVTCPSCGNCIEITAEENCTLIAMVKAYRERNNLN